MLNKKIKRLAWDILGKFNAHSETHHFSLSMYGFLHLSSLVVTFLLWLSISNQNVLSIWDLLSEILISIWKIKTLMEYAKRVSFMSFPLDSSSRDRNLHQYHRQKEFIYLHNICIECIHAWLQWVPLPPLLQSDFVCLHVKMKPLPSGRHSSTEKRECN